MSKPIIKIKKEAMDRIWQYIQGHDEEISGFGYAYINNERNVTSSDNSIILEEVFLLEQECTGASTTIKEAGIHKYLGEEMRRAIKAEEMPRPINVWWHSHVNMACNWSGTDHNNMGQYMNSAWHVHIVGNKRFEYKCRVISYKPIRHDWEDCELMIINGNDKFHIPEEIKQEIKEKVTKREIISYMGGGVPGYLSGIKHHSSLNTPPLFSEFDLGDRIWIESRDKAGEYLEGIITDIDNIGTKTYTVYVEKTNESYIDTHASEMRKELDVLDSDIIYTSEELGAMLANLDVAMEKEDFDEAIDIAMELDEADKDFSIKNNIPEIIELIYQIPDADLDPTLTEEDGKKAKAELSSMRKAAKKKNKK